jgi:microcystin-dependent protein
MTTASRGRTRGYVTRQVTTASTAGTTICNSGLTVISTSGGTSHTLEAPEIGSVKHLVSTTAATATTVTVAMASTSVNVNASGTSIIFNGPYTAVTLYGQSATQWLVVGNNLGTGTAGTVTYGTS